MKPAMHIASRPIPGEHYRPSCGQCNIPPWEECACSPLLRDVIAERINADLDERFQLLLLE